jgi:ATP-dependent Lon protease
MLLQLEWLTSPSWTTTDSSETSMRSDFLANSQSQLGVHHYGFEKVKHRLMEYLAVVRLRALIAQEAEVEQASAQGAMPKKTIDEPAAETDNQQENAC